MSHQIKPHGDTRPFDAVLHSHRRFAHVQRHLPRQPPVFPADSEEVLGHPQREIFLVPRLQLEMNKPPVRRFPEQIHATVVDFLYFDIEPSERQGARELREDGTAWPGQDVFQSYIVFMHRASTNGGREPENFSHC
jgi:hypothetical protein